MPIYEYRCPECGHQFEQMMRLSDPAPACPSCGTAEVRKLVSQTSFILKGGGWYSDHYGLKKSSDGEAKGGEAKAEAPKAAESKASEAAPAAPSAPAAPASSGSGGTT